MEVVSGVGPLSLISPPRMLFSSQKLQHWFTRRSNAIHFPLISYTVEVAAAKKSKSTSFQVQAQDEEDDVGDDALEALFSQLETDLARDALPDEESDKITGKKGAKLEEEFDRLVTEEEEIEHCVTNLEDWQLQKLAHALEVGRRKVSIKKISTELGLERRQVLRLLQSPPPQLLMVVPSQSSAISTESVCNMNGENEKPTRSNDKSSNRISGGPGKVAADSGLVYQSLHNTRKRIKKANLATLEKVYERTHYPNDSMVDSIVHLTNMPRKSVVKWFIERRLQEKAQTTE
eukprot:TRINITY_DN1878_c0_g1_i1.p1 TRINITY_DN1878_c0_g1~~TRINITY_DN1878_c0_g1_i1.p1  ORF type:complete len:290 (-),score=75.11 TRINITY_DN1878_c0_g1_i1:308-1177(-)